MIIIIIRKTNTYTEKNSRFTYIVFEPFSHHLMIMITDLFRHMEQLLYLQINWSIERIFFLFLVLLLLNVNFSYSFVFIFILFYFIEKKIWNEKKALNWIECVEKTNIKCVCVENESRITNQMMMMIKLEIDWLLVDTILL